MVFKFLKYEVSNRVAWIKFNRPDQLNAMNRQMMDEIIESLELVHSTNDGKIAVAVITGEGKAFMAGADIKEYAQQTEEEFEAFQLMGRRLYAAIEKNSKPIIAAINGYAFGGGFEIALSCDMILCRQYAKLGLPEINLNLIPGGGGTQRLTRKIGSNLANEMIMTGRAVTAEEMWAKGVVNHIYEKEGFNERVGEFVAQLTDKPVDRLRAIKQLTRKCLGEVDVSALDMENEQLGKFYSSEEGQGKIQEFYQKSLNNK
ncbi:enoyl-CoA hydratase/isomerase family protein [Zobellia galactanivorans]|uniref:enoyl-CoA hydratase/isomerase family protein n=1 Tax=Zobellia galactanivorans (strain DSM 12802 / CCUG 47099 / CIP 106680 / NCIMB 13871 / Dsij) TaxID=63186 RepID=UPI001C067B6E|nr:enoyl-CoA hydratase/isomerase family protein [Zobellia galactanivorans]MBU3027932.1 enoyl-CoA hydratase/isomerase family protein [Zobellia galactanivorans]